jgi:hypothetical protein
MSATLRDEFYLINSSTYYSLYPDIFDDYALQSHVSDHFEYSSTLLLGPRYDHFYDGYYTFLPHVHMRFSSFKGAF